MHITPRDQALGDNFYRRIGVILHNEVAGPAERTDALRRLLQEVFERASETDKLHFSTHYARIAYVAHQFGLPKALTWAERRFRRTPVSGMPPEVLTAHLAVGIRVALTLTQALFSVAIPATLSPAASVPLPSYRPPARSRFFPLLRVVGTHVDTEAGILHVKEERESEVAYRIPYGQAELQEGPVAAAVSILQAVTGPALTLNLINAELREDGLLYPAQIVLEPDYLVNVTDVAQCFAGGSGHQPWTSLPGRLLPFEKRPPLVRGNIVNACLDVLIQDPETRFRDVLQSVFAMQPLELCTFTNQEVKRLVADVKHHFLTVQKFVREELPALGMDRERVMLEPTFFAPDYGLQGRLDLLQSQTDSADGRTSIVELKTSKIYRPNRHEIRHENYIQTLLYDLMITRSLGRGANVLSYILYSIDYAKPIRLAPREFTLQMTALSARNQLVALEMLIAQLGEGDLRQQTDTLFGRLEPDRIDGLGRFSVDDHRTVLATYAELDDLERRYFGAFMGFVAREQRLAKIGEQHTEHIHGLASLWLDERAAKVERFELLDGLEFSAYRVQENILELARATTADQLVKFRQGDIVALYGTPAAATGPGDVVGSQIFKSTIVEVTQDAIRLRLRNPQLSDAVFRRVPFWAIEKDVLDSSFKNHYLGLYLWALAETRFSAPLVGPAPAGASRPPPRPHRFRPDGRARPHPAQGGHRSRLLLAMGSPRHRQDEHDAAPPGQVPARAHRGKPAAGRLHQPGGG